jgi:hypothetical protein
MERAYKTIRINSQIGFPAEVNMISSKLEFELKKLVLEKIPIKALDLVSKLPIVGTPSLKKKAKQLVSGS